MTVMDNGKLLKAALWYVEKKHWPVLPLHTIHNRKCTCSKGAACENPGKHPRWEKDTLEHGAKDATTDPEQVQRWWSKWPDSNVGIATGDRSFDVLDVDLKGDGPDTLRELELLHGDLPDTVEQITGSGGRQVMFQPTGGKLTNAVKFASGLDIRTNGGLVVVPPSRHISGGIYEWEASSRPNEKDLAPCPDWIVTLVSQSAGKPQGNEGDNGSCVDVGAIWEGIPEGQRDIELYRYACRLRSQNMSRQEAELLVLTAAGRCRPPFPREEAGKKVEQAWKHQAGGSQQSCEKKTCEDEDDLEPDVLTWPTLDRAALAGLAGEFVQLATRHSEADPAAVLATFLVRLSAEIGNGPYLMVGDTKHYVRLFAALVGDTSKARKGTSHGPVERCFAGLRRFAAAPLLEASYRPARSTPGPLSSGEGLIYAVRDPVEKAVKDKKTGETRMEVIDPGVDDKRLFVIDEEFAGAISCTKREGNTLSTVLRCAWDHGNQDPLTKNSKISATGGHICVCGHITRSELRRKLEESEAFNGFSNRFLWVCSRRNGRIPFPRPIAEEDLSAFQRKLHAIIEFSASVSEIRMDGDAKELWAEQYDELSADHDGLVGAVVNRGEAQVLRLSMIYALMSSSSTITAEHLRAALAFWAYCKASAEYVFHGFEADPVADKILKKVQAEGPLEWTALYQLFSNNLSKATIDAAVNDLTRKSKLMIETASGDRGRPRRILFTKDQKENALDEVNEEKEVIPTSSIVSLDEQNEVNEVIQPPSHGEGITSFSSFTSSRDIPFDSPITSSAPDIYWLSDEAVDLDPEEEVVI